MSELHSNPFFPFFPLPLRLFVAKQHEPKVLPDILVIDFPPPSGFDHFLSVMYTFSSVFWPQQSRSSNFLKPTLWCATDINCLLTRRSACWLSPGIFSSYSLLFQRGDGFIFHKQRDVCSVITHEQTQEKTPVFFLAGNMKFISSVPN